MTLNHPPAPHGRHVPCKVARPRHSIAKRSASSTQIQHQQTDPRFPPAMSLTFTASAPVGTHHRQSACYNLRG